MRTHDKKNDYSNNLTTFKGHPFGSGTFSGRSKGKGQQKLTSHKH